MRIQSQTIRFISRRAQIEKIKANAFRGQPDESVAPAGSSIVATPSSHLTAGFPPASIHCLSLIIALVNFANTKKKSPSLKPGCKYKSSVNHGAMLYNR